MGGILGCIVTELFTFPRARKVCVYYPIEEQAQQHPIFSVFFQFVGPQLGNRVSRTRNCFLLDWMSGEINKTSQGMGPGESPPYVQSVLGRPPHHKGGIYTVSLGSCSAGGIIECLSECLKRASKAVQLTGMIRCDAPSSSKVLGNVVSKFTRGRKVK